MDFVEHVEPVKNPGIEFVKVDGDKTTVFFEDGLSTTVTREPEDNYDLSVAVAYAVAKKFLGNKFFKAIKDF